MNSHLEVFLLPECGQQFAQGLPAMAQLVLYRGLEFGGGAVVCRYPEYRVIAKAVVTTRLLQDTALTDDAVERLARLDCTPARAFALAAEAIAITQSKRAAPRVAFGTVVELGIVRPGTRLVDGKRRYRAEVRADGSIVHNGVQGSIHRLGAEVQGRSACNGWTFWHVEREGKLEPIDTLREKARRELGAAGEHAAEPGAAEPQHFRSRVCRSR